ncbi:MAG: AraC family transcriptional regulator [Pseudomonadota bacterium]
MGTPHTGIWGRTLLESLQQKGFPPEMVAGNTGINIQAMQSDDPRVSFEDLALLFERAAELTGDDLIGFNQGRNWEFKRGGLVTYTGISSPTVRTLLLNLARYQRIIGDAIDIDASSFETHGVAEWQFKVPRSVVRRQYVEFGGTGIVELMRRLTGRQVTPKKVEFRHFRKSNIKTLSSFFGCPIEFGMDMNRLSFKLSDLELPLSSADENLHRLLRKFGDDALEKLGASGSRPSVVLKVEACIAANAASTQASVAKELGMSTRTLSRRLSEAGTTFFDIVENYREAIARSMLAQTDFQITEIAYVLGYSDLSTFSTAFKRWTGQTPSQFKGAGTKQSGATPKVRDRNSY